MMKATAKAPANIAFIKYWGNQDERLRIPVNDSLSMNLDGLVARTTVTWDEQLQADTLVLNGQSANAQATARVSEHLSFVRERLGLRLFAHVESVNNFPMGAGIASSAAAFAALTVGSVTASGQTLSERELTTLARFGSGSASRSVPTGFVQWYQGDSHETSYAESFALPEHWDLVDVVAVISDSHKAVGSRVGHTSAGTSDLQLARVAGARERVSVCKTAILNHDFASFAEVVEHDSNLMHAVMMTSKPPLFYWQPASLTVMEAVRQWRSEGLSVCYTLDAGANVHCLTTAQDAPVIVERLSQIEGVKTTLQARVGQGASIEND